MQYTLQVVSGSEHAPSQAAGEISGVGERDSPSVLVLGKWIDCGDVRKGTGL